MPSTASTRLRIEQIGEFEKTNAWAGSLNAALQRLDDAVAQFTTIALTGNYTLTSANFIEDEARAAMLRFTGAGSFIVTVPAVSKHYSIINDCTGDLTVTPSGGTGSVVRAGTRMVVAIDGSVARTFDTTLDKVALPVASVSLNSQKITNLATPTLTGDAATKGYVDTFTADRSAGGFKLTGLANATLGTQDATPVSQVVSLINSATVNLPVQTGNSGRFLTTDGTNPSWSLVPLATAVSGTLPVANGGTGATTLTANRVLLGNGTGAIAVAGAGTSGQVLTSNGASAPTFQNIPASLPGNIVQTVKTDTFTTTSTSFTDITGLSVAITPSAATSRVKISGTVSVGPETFTRAAIQLVRNSTAIGIGDAAGSRTRATAVAMSVENSGYQNSVSFEFIDSPATTSSTTYKVQIVTSSGTVAVNRSSFDSDAVNHFRPISSIRVEEIAAT